MCNSQSLFFISNLFLLFTGLGILLYCALALHVYSTSYGSDVNDLNYFGMRDGYRGDPLVYDDFITPREPTLWDSIRMLFGGEDYNNYRNNNELLKGSTKIAVTRRKRQLFDPMYRPNYIPYTRPVIYPSYNGYQPNNGFMRNYYSDDTRLLDNPNFVNLVFATLHVCIMILVVLLGLFATISLSISGSLSSFMIRVYVWISFIIIILTIILGVYLCSTIDRNTNYQQSHLMRMYRFYNHNNPKSFSTHFIDTLQVHLECCGSNSPADFSLITSGSPIALPYSNWLPRSCCARNRDELAATWIRNHQTPLFGNNVGFGNECSIMMVPEEHKKGCLNLVRNMVQTWYTVMMLWCLLTVIFLLIAIITGNQIKSENDYIIGR